jgi:hypothetical protein
MKRAQPALPRPDLRRKTWVARRLRLGQAHIGQVEAAEGVFCCQ